MLWSSARASRTGLAVPSASAASTIARVGWLSAAHACATALACSAGSRLVRIARGLIHTGAVGRKPSAAICVSMRGMQTSQLQGRTALVTGAGSGIGRATALLCAQRGARLVICDVDEHGLEATAAEARALGREVVAERVDVSRRDEMRAFADAVGAPDLLVNTAGVGLGGKFADTQLEDRAWAGGINLLAVVHGRHFFFPIMIEPGS